jgi:hypothetical protein
MNGGQSGVAIDMSVDVNLSTCTPLIPVASVLAYAIKTFIQSAAFGVAFAMCVCAARDARLLNECTHGYLLPSRRIALAAVAGAVLALAVGSSSEYSLQSFSQAYVLLIFNCRTRTECDEFHSYVAFVPVCTQTGYSRKFDLQIVSYLILRNMFGWMRSKVSHFFAWFGRIALEVNKIVQKHIYICVQI